MNNKTEKLKPIVLSIPLFDNFMKEPSGAKLLCLYCFYLKTASIQKTNQIKCTTFFVTKGLKWNKDTVNKYKKKLIELGLIENIKRKNPKGKIEGWYIKVNYIWKSQTLEKPEYGIYQRLENTPPNALSSDNLNALSSDIKKHPPKNEFLLDEIKEEEYEKRLRAINGIIFDNKEARNIANNPEYDSELIYKYCSCIEQRFEKDNSNIKLFLNMLNDPGIYNINFSENQQLVTNELK